MTSSFPALSVCLGLACFPSLAAGQITNLKSLEVEINTASQSDFQTTEEIPPVVHYVALNNPTPAPPYTNWITAATNIQDAIDVAVTGSIVLVSNGVYETGGRINPGNILTNRVHINKPVTVRSVNGPEFTIIKGRKNPITTNGAQTARCVYITNGASLVGFTLTNGSTFGNNIVEPPQSGGGAWCETGAVLSNCVITGNSAHLYGAGVYRGTLYNCSLIGNSVTDDGGGAYNSTLNGCYLAGNSAHLGGGTYGGILNDCIVISNSAFAGGGVYSSTLNRSILSSNSAINAGGGACVSTLNNCLITGNMASDGGGVSGGMLRNCTVVHNIADAGGGTFGATLKSCIVYFNTATVSNNYHSHNKSPEPVYTCTTPLPTNIGNIANNPLFVNAETGDYRLQLISPCINAGLNDANTGTNDLDGLSRIEGSVVDMGAYEFRSDAASPWHYVAAENPNPAFPYITWNTAARTIQEAIDAAEPGDAVIVSNGVYETGGRKAPGSQITNRVFINKPVVVKSVNGAAFTTIRGVWVAGTINGTRAVRCVWMTNNATLTGFTLTRGATLVTSSNSNDFNGGGLWAQSHAAVVYNCIISSNSAHNYGGGSIAGTLNDSILSSNSAMSHGGAAYDGILNNCALTANSANLGGGAGNSTLNRCSLIGNSANFHGGGAFNSILNDCILSANAAANHGGGTYSGTLKNCTLTGNDAQIDGGGSFGGTLVNCIVYFNSSPGSVNHSGGTISYSCTSPLPAGTGNFTNDPLLVDAPISNFTLSAGSPCRDTGSNVNAPSKYDFGGNPRIVNASVDMGAHEYQSGPVADYDDDGMPNADETIAGSSPVDNSDVWKITSLPNTNPTWIEFNTVIGSIYSVDRNDQLEITPQIWNEITNNIPGSGGMITIVDPVPGSNRAYRVRAARSP